MLKEEILELHGKSVSLDMLKQIEQHELVDRVVNCGASGNDFHKGQTWYVVEFCDENGEPTGEEISVYY